MAPGLIGAPDAVPCRIHAEGSSNVDVVGAGGGNGHLRVAIVAVVALVV